MSNDIKYLILFSLLYAIILFLGELIYKTFNLKSEVVRKSVHFLIGISTLLFPFYFKNYWSVGLLSIIFLLLMLISKHFGFLKSINKINRQSFGSYYYPLSISLVFIIYFFSKDLVLYYLPILILSICDPIAALTGIKYKAIMVRKNNDSIIIQFGTEGKTYIGSFFFFITSIIITYYTLSFFYRINSSKMVLETLSIALISSFTEAISKKGSDNITIPISVVLSLLLFKYYFLSLL